MPWSEQPALASLELGSYDTTTDGTGSVTVQSRFQNCEIAVFDESCTLWQTLN